MNTVDIPVSAGQRIAEEFGYDQVVIIARKVGVREHVTTYGIDKDHCGVAARIGNFIKHKLMGWRGLQEITWPKERRVGRMGDMAPPGKTHMTVMLDCDNDVCVSIWDMEAGEGKLAGIEFCAIRGGGVSTNTRIALINLMVAMEQDNAESPRKQWPPVIVEPAVMIK